MSRSYWVYIITNHTNNVLYTGITNNIQRRIFEHRKGIIENTFSKKYRLYKLVWCEKFGSVLEAIAAEKKIKGWTRVKKLNLIMSLNPKFDNLSLR